MAAKTVKAAATLMAGASRKTHSSAPAGMMSSLSSSFNPSATGCKQSPRAHAHRSQARLHEGQNLPLHVNQVGNNAREDRQHNEDLDERKQERVGVQEFDGALNHGDNSLTSRSDAFTLGGVARDCSVEVVEAAV